VNYEDRTDLVDPGELIPSSTLKRLARAPSDAVRVLAETESEDALRLTGPDAAAIDELVRRDAQLDGAAKAPCVSRLALTSGYRYGKGVLGAETSEEPVALLVDTVDRIFAYALIDYACPPDPVDLIGAVRESMRQRAVRVCGVEPWAFEEHAFLHWSLGLALAVVDARGMHERPLAQ
jgi:hypothetical protein